MTPQEKFTEIDRILKDQGLRDVPPEPVDVLRPVEFDFIVADNTSEPTPNFSCYAKLESDS